MLKGNFYVLFFIFCLLQISCNNYAPKEDIILTDTLNRDDFSIDSIKITDSLTMILWDNLTIHNKNYIEFIFLNNSASIVNVSNGFNGYYNLNIESLRNTDLIHIDNSNTVNELINQDFIYELLPAKRYKLLDSIICVYINFQFGSCNKEIEQNLGKNYKLINSTHSISFSSREFQHNIYISEDSTQNTLIQYNAIQIIKRKQ